MDAQRAIVSHQTDDTIAAIATGTGPAGIAIIRISGSRSREVADRVFRCRPPSPSARAHGTFVYGHVHDGNADLDEGLLLVMRAPRSYTHEDVIELQVHGGFVAVRRCLRAVLAAGARLAEPGEFTLRAFLNGRLDLVQSEAVMDLIRSTTERAAQIAVEQLEGGLSLRVSDLYAKLINISSAIEILLDFDDDDTLVETELPTVETRLDQSQSIINELLRSFEGGRLIREGALVVICGPPNVGKSTIMNKLLEKDRVIVSPFPGTTRDSIEEGLVINGISVRLIDTAGLRDTECPIEQSGISRTRTYIERADLILYIIDASTPWQDQWINERQSIENKHMIIIANKSDLGCVPDRDLTERYTVLFTTMVGEDTQRDILKIRDIISERLSFQNGDPHLVPISERHRQHLSMAAQDLAHAREMLSHRDMWQLIIIAAEIKHAAEEVGRITGRNYYTDLLSAIFSTFCIGK